MNALPSGPGRIDPAHWDEPAMRKALAVVMAYDVLSRICDGLGAPRGYMGLAYDETSAATSDPEDAATQPVEVIEWRNT